MNPDLWRFEEEQHRLGYQYICGVDEAGRGPLAGPVFAAAVILDPQRPVEGLNDSKKLSSKKREVLFKLIQETAVAYGIASASEQEIDEINILNASFLAMRRAIDLLTPAPDFVLVDGNMVRNIDLPAKSIVKGDALSASIAAASILAKVSRDRFMMDLAGEYPMYEFQRHKGYPTKLHYEKLREFGACPVHRRTFLKSLTRTEKGAGR